MVNASSLTAGAASPRAPARRERGTVLGESLTADTVLVSHPDRDHYNALPYLLDGVSIGQIQVVGAAAEYSGPFVAWLDGLPCDKKRRRFTARRVSSLGCVALSDRSRAFGREL